MLRKWSLWSSWFVWNLRDAQPEYVNERGTALSSAQSPRRHHHCHQGHHCHQHQPNHHHHHHHHHQQQQQPHQPHRHHRHQQHRQQQHHLRHRHPQHYRRRHHQHHYLILNVINIIVIVTSIIQVGVLRPLLRGSASHSWRSASSSSSSSYDHHHHHHRSRSSRHHSAELLGKPVAHRVVKKQSDSQDMVGQTIPCISAANLSHRQL